MKTAIAGVLSTISTGLLAGAFLFATLNVVPTFYEVSPAVHLTFRVQLMSRNSLTMQSLMLAGILVPLGFAWLGRRSTAVRNLALLAALFTLTSLLITRFGNVPINVVIRSWAADAPPPDWLEKLHRWDRFHAIRTIAALAGFLCASIAAGLPLGRLRESTNAMIAREAEASG